MVWDVIGLLCFCIPPFTIPFSFRGGTPKFDFLCLLTQDQNFFMRPQGAWPTVPAKRRFIEFQWALLIFRLISFFRRRTSSLSVSDPFFFMDLYFLFLFLISFLISRLIQGWDTFFFQNLCRDICLNSFIVCVYEMLVHDLNFCIFQIQFM